jgi:hypothetical protein
MMALAILSSSSLTIRLLISPISYSFCFRINLREIVTLVPTPFSEEISNWLLSLGAITFSSVLAILRPRLIPLEFSVVALL